MAPAEPLARALRILDGIVDADDTPEVPADAQPFAPVEAYAGDAEATATQRAQPARNGIALTWAETLDGDEAYPRQLIDGLFDRVGKAMIPGASGAGKSTLAINMACDIGSGRKCNGRSTLPGVAVIVAAEAPEGVRRRIKAYAKHHGIRASEISVAILERPLSFDPGAVELLIERIRHDAGARQLPVRFVLIDTLAANEPGKEDSEHFGRVVAALTQISTELDCMAAVVHHFGKNTEAGARGHTSLYAAMDTVIEVTVDGPTRTAKVAKQRDGASGEAFAFSLQPVGIGFRETDNSAFRETVTACVVQYEGAATIHVRPPREGHQTRALDALRIDAKATQRTRWTLREAADVVRAHHEHVVGAREPLHRNTPRKTIEALSRSGHVLIDGGFVTLEEV
jgi:hypothetical protein